MIGSDMVFDGGISNVGRPPSECIGHSDRRPPRDRDADKRHARRDLELELPATTDVETDMTYAITGAGHDARAVLAAKDIPILIANLRGPETLDELVPGIGQRVTPMSAFRPSRTFPG